MSPSARPPASQEERSVTCTFEKKWNLDLCCFVVSRSRVCIDPCDPCEAISEMSCRKKQCGSSSLSFLGTASDYPALGLIKISSQVMQKSCRVNFMFGELTDKETISNVYVNTLPIYNSQNCLALILSAEFKLLIIYHYRKDWWSRRKLFPGSIWNSTLQKEQ